MLKHHLKLFFIAFMLVLGGCGALQKSDPMKDWTPEKLYDEAKSQLNSGAYDKAIKLFETLEARYPFGVFAQQAQMEVAYAYYRQNDQAQTLAAAERFIRLHPNHPNVDYMYYLRGLANFNDRGNLFNFLSPQDPTERDPKAARDAFDAFRQLVERFPESRYAEDARDRLKYLVNAMAQYEVHVAGYYLRRGVFLAAVNRAQTVIKNYPDSPAVKEALTIQVRAYDAMGLNDLRDDAQRVYKKNFEAADKQNKANKSWWRFW